MIAAFAHITVLTASRSDLSARLHLLIVARAPTRPLGAAPSRCCLRGAKTPTASPSSKSGSVFPWQASGTCQRSAIGTSCNGSAGFQSLHSPETHTLRLDSVDLRGMKRQTLNISFKCRMFPLVAGARLALKCTLGAAVRTGELWHTTTASDSWSRQTLTFPLPLSFGNPNGDLLTLDFVATIPANSATWSLGVDTFTMGTTW